ncbi:RTA1-domain-containing protein [Calocera viscosa TUFC12733]|uniref:RTA1-domain-containing protein n=1 Tax=Calocera viscosa (strain TUFC12733) TaxID=1330018 RepID=A0A167KMB8_CALVF|nr:RTA1-domain-containing protein [Calocera viscosa TUFC12733]
MLPQSYLNRWIAALILLPLTVSALDYPYPIPDPFADPANDPYNPLRYIPSNALTGVSLALYLVTGLSTSFYAWRYGARWMLAMVIGTYTFSVGLAMRFALAQQPHNTTFYIIEYLFVVLSPCAFIAADYVLLSHLATWLDAGAQLVISPRRVTLVFVLSDVTTFCIQAIGGGMSVTRDQATLTRGSHIFVAGLAMQLLSFFLFTLMYLRFLWRLRKLMPDTWNTAKWYQSWKLLSFLLLLSCGGILIRSFYRTIELSEGFTGYLAIHEVYFYALDTYPLYVAITVYLFVWPGWILTEDARMKFLSKLDASRPHTTQDHPTGEPVPETLDPSQHATDESPASDSMHEKPLDATQHPAEEHPAGDSVPEKALEHH